MTGARTIVATLGIVLAVTGACRGGNRQTTDKKLVILGFDGLDPDLTARWVEGGRLPNLASLVEQGGLYRLETSHAPESPTAWALFATGVQAGQHDIYSALVRDPATYQPGLGMTRVEPGRFLLDYFPISRPRAYSTLRGTPFWITAGQAGIRSSVLTVPVTYPPETVPNGELLSGLPLPDIRGTMGTYHYFATDVGETEEGRTDFGGILRRLVPDGDVARTELDGPPNPVVRQQIRGLRARAPLADDERARLADLEAAADVRLPMTVRWNRGAPERSATVEIARESVYLRPGEWSRWVRLEFRVNAWTRLRGMVQFHLIDADRELKLYVSPIHWLPEDPPLPMSSPASFSADLFERLGTYRTLAWAEATWPLQDGRLDERTFMEDLYRAFDDRAQVILNRLGSRDWDLLVGVIESTDRVQHMMWRLIDPVHPRYDAALAKMFGPAIERVYRRADLFVAQVLEMIEPGTPLLVVSDHGFHAWRRSVNLNTWLVQEGYMTVRRPASNGHTVGDLFADRPFWEHVDWSRTRAYALGLGQIYVNLRGREVSGIVGAGAEYRTLVDELKARLRTMTDPDSGAPIIRAVYARDDVYAGDSLPNAPDLQVGFEDGYRVSWGSMVGSVEPGLVTDNLGRWSGDHGGYDYTTTAGVLIANRPLEVDAARLIDIAPTVLDYFGVPVPTSLGGRPLF